MKKLKITGRFNPALRRGLEGLLLILAALLIPGHASAQVGGKITGVVSDASGAVIAQATVTVVNAETRIKQTVTTGDNGVYAFPALPVGRYDLSVSSDGFKPYSRTGLVIDINTSLALDVVLEVGKAGEEVTVEARGSHVETSDTQLGQVIGSAQVTDIPLNGRSYTDLLAIQGGVTPVTTSAASNSTSGGGFGTVPVAGNGNTGQFSIHGQRESANGFSLNGATVQEGIGQQAGIIPNLDSIAEFRILTSNTDAEYGGYSGGLIDVVTKSGTDRFHGSMFEFLRNIALDARGFFSPERSTFHQNQYGGTFGGPIRKGRIFFFIDYQGQGTSQGIETGIVNVPSLANRAGNFSNSASTLTGVVNGTVLAQTLSSRLGYQIRAGEPFYTPGCVTTAQCVFPRTIIPQSAFALPAARMLQYIPLPNFGANEYSSGAEKQTLNDRKGSARIDANTIRYGAFSVYYFADGYNLDNPYPSGFGGATLPGPTGPYDALSVGLDQLIVLSNTRTFGSSAVNEARLSLTRLNNDLGVPKGGVGVSLAQQGISDGLEGIKQGYPQYAGVETLYFNSFTVGANPFALLQTNNTFDVYDNFSKVVGNHTLKTGGHYLLYKVKQVPDLVANGTFSFFGSGAQSTGNGFADFLLGLPDFYSQQSSPGFYESYTNAGLFIQDSWRLRSNVTFNYGLRWDYITPWAEKRHQTTTLVPGAQSETFPGAPAGYLVPGDRLPDGSTIPNAIAPSPRDNFSPRLGLAYSPAWKGGFLSRLTGGPGKTSIRLGAGRFFSAIEGLTVAYPTGNPPYGLTYTSPEPPEMAQPFIGALTGTNYVQQFPVNVPPYNVSPGNPDANVNWARYEPIGGAGSVWFKNKTPYTMTMNLTVERQIGEKTLLSASYIGSLSRHLLTVVEANPGNPGLCLSLSAPRNVARGTPTCGPFGENGIYTRRDGTIVNGTRFPFGNAFASDAWYSNMGNSNYNAFEVTLKRTIGRLTLLATYTYSKSLDQSSSIQEQVNPFNYGKEYGISAFDVKHDFVASYNYDIPFNRLFRKTNRLTLGWAISGITRFASGLPVTFASFGDSALIGAQNNGVNSVSIDLPDVSPGNLDLNHNPRNGHSYFNTSLFSPNQPGTPGTSSRRFFYGPGLNNWDFALHKVTAITEGKTIEIRFEAFNALNHAQFFGANSVDGNINSPTFGRVVRAMAPRIAQAAVKFTF